MGEKPIANPGSDKTTPVPGPSRDCSHVSGMFDVCITPKNKRELESGLGRCAGCVFDDKDLRSSTKRIVEKNGQE